MLFRSRKRKKVSAAGSRNIGINADTSQKHVRAYGNDGMRQGLPSLGCLGMHRLLRAGNGILFLLIMQRGKAYSGFLPQYFFYSLQAYPCLQAVPR